MHPAQLFGLHDELEKLAETEKERARRYGRNGALIANAISIPGHMRLHTLGNALGSSTGTMAAAHGLKAALHSGVGYAGGRLVHRVAHGEATDKQIETEKTSSIAKAALAGGDDLLGGLVGYHYGRKQKERGEAYHFGGKQVASLLLPGGLGYQIGRGVGHGSKLEKKQETEKKSSVEKIAISTNFVSKHVANAAKSSSPERMKSFAGRMAGKIDKAYESVGGSYRPQHHVSKAIDTGMLAHHGAKAIHDVSKRDNLVRGARNAAHAMDAAGYGMGGKVLRKQSSVEKVAKKLTTKERNHLPKKDFALPGGRYPIEDKNHARNALARASQHASPEEKATIERKVHAKYPGIK